MFRLCLPSNARKLFEYFGSRDGLTVFDFWADDARALTWTTNVLVKSESLGLGGIAGKPKTSRRFFWGRRLERW